MIIGNIISPFRKRRTSSAGYDSAAEDLFAKWASDGTPASTSDKVIYNNTIVALKAAGYWQTRDCIYLDCAHSQVASLVDIKNPTTRTASVVGGMTWSTSGWLSNGTTGRLDTNYNPGDGLAAYNFTQNDNSIGCYIGTKVFEAKIDFSAQSVGSVGIDLLASTNTTSNTIGSKNNNGTQRTAVAFSGIGYVGTKRTASNAWRITNNGYDIYTAATPTDASVAVLNSSINRFCRKVDTTYSNYTIRPQRYFQAGSSMDEFDFNRIIEQYYLIPKGLCPTKRVVLNGNSFISSGVPVSRMLTSIGYTNEVYNRGVSGQTIVQMQTDAVTTVFPMTKSYLTKNVFFVWELTNDLVNTGNATTTYNNLVTYCQALKAAQPDAIIIVATCMPRTNITPDTLRQNDADLTDSTTLNGKVRINALGLWIVCDTASDLTMGQSGQWSNTTYYNVDGIHPNTTGYNLLTDTYITPSVSAAL